MTLERKRIVIVIMSGAFIASLLFVQWMEVLRKREELGKGEAHVSVPAASKDCVECHAKSTSGIVDHWKGSTHARKGVACVDCHSAAEGDADAYQHYGALIATIVTPRDCSRCHQEVTAEFAASHHAKGGNILPLQTKNGDVVDSMGWAAVLIDGKGGKNGRVANDYVGLKLGQDVL